MEGWKNTGPLPGRVIAGYRIEAQLGKGGMGVVYKAVDLELQRAVALKFIPEETVGDPGARERFLREARAASRLDHVNVGTIFGVEQTDEGQIFIVMAYYDGETLAAAIKRGPIGAAKARNYCIQMARGLAEAHSHGIIHRDVKPSNVLITRGGVLKLVDFGLAQVADATRLTHPGSRLGTPSYMSPEQAQGLPVDQRGDIWSLGVILYEMVTGAVPFQADSIPATLYKIVHSPPPTLDGIDPEFRGIVSKAIAKEPGQRHQSMAELLRDLGDTVPGGDSEAVPSELAPTLELPPTTRSPPGSARAGLGRSKKLLATATAGAALLLALLFVPGSPLRLGGPDSSSAESPVTSTLKSAPAAYEKYLAGVAALERWDKGDNLATAVGLFEEAAKLDPEFALAYAKLSEGHRLQSILGNDQKLADKAIQEAQQAAQLNPELAPVQVALGRAHVLRGDNDLALASLQRALELDAHNVYALIAIAGVYERLGRRDDAEATFRRAIAVQPNSWEAHNALGNFYFGQRDYDGAIEHWRRILEITPDNAVAYTNLGAAFAESGKLAEAQTMYERAVAIKPNYTVYMNLGSVLYREGRYAEASKRFEEALQLSDGDYLVWGNLAAAYWWMPGERAKAIETFEKAASMAEEVAARSPTDPYANSDLGQYYAKLGRTGESTRRLKAALALSPEDPEIHAWAAEAYEVLGERDKALELVRRALKLGYSPEMFQRSRDLKDLCADARFPK